METGPAFGGDNPFGDNDPYKSPAIQTPGSYGMAPGPNKVGQIRLVAILSMVQGVLELLYGAMMASVGVFMPALMANAAKNDPNFNRNPAGPSPEFFENFAFWMYMGFGIASAVVGLLRIVAAIQNYRLRGRILGIVAMVVGVVNVIACYCVPTAIGLLIYGLIVYLSPEVIAAFRMRDEGEEVDAIFKKFGA